MDLTAKPWSAGGWVVDLLPSLTGTKRRRVFGKTPDEAVERAESWLQERRTLGPLQDISTAERALLWRYRAVLSLAEMEAAFQRAAGERVQQVTVERALAEYTEQHITRWEISTQRGCRYGFRRFLEAFPNRTVQSLKPRELADFLSAQGKSQPNFRRWINGFLNWCHRVCEYTDRNPLLHVPRVAIPRESKVVFTPAQMARLLEASRTHHPTLALVVLGGLAGLRNSECLRARWGDLRGRTLHIPRMKTRRKGMRERYIELNDAAMAWLSLIPRGKPKERIVGNNQANSRKNINRIRRLAKVGWPRNVLRRSYGSHHIAAHENADLTAKLMGHTSADETYADYYRAITKRQGVEWFGLRP